MLAREVCRGKVSNPLRGERTAYRGDELYRGRVPAVEGAGVRVRWVSSQLRGLATDIVASVPSQLMNKSASVARSAFPRQAGFSLVEMIGVLAIIAILAVVIVPKVFSTIASSRVTSAVGSVNTMRTAVTEFAGKYGTIPLTGNNARIDDLLMATEILDSRFTAKIGTQPGTTPIPGSTWSNATGTWVATGGSSQIAQSRVVSYTSAVAAIPGLGTNYRLDGTATGNLPAGARVVSTVLTGVSIGDARELSLKFDGDSMTQPTTSVLADTVGKVTYAAPTGTTTTVYIYLAHQ